MKKQKIRIYTLREEEIARLYTEREMNKIKENINNMELENP